MRMQKPFQVVRINTNRKELLVKLSKAKDHMERNKLLQNAMYPNRLKRVDEERK